jgi:hypothetical protein
MCVVLRLAVVDAVAPIMTAASAPIAYVAYRLRSDCFKTYDHFQPVSSQGANPYWSYTNSVDALRQTAQQRGGSSSASWQMWEWALGSCS